MKTIKKERLYIAIYEKKDGTRTDLVFRGTFHKVYKNACINRPLDSELIELRIA